MKQDRKNEKVSDRINDRKKRLFLIFLCIGVLILILIAGVWLTIRHGRNRIRKQAAEQIPKLVSIEDNAEEAEVPEHWEEGWVRYNGKIYEYNSNILTFLLLGIDKEEKTSENRSLTDGGQSDAIFLLVADPDKEMISLIGVNRDTIVDVQMIGIGENGQDIIYPAQLTVQHAFGDGLEGSCELTKARVSELFYDLPIHAYVSFNMGGIAELNDALGGVEVTVLEDLTKKNKEWTEGREVTLKGKDAFWYVKWRDTDIFESARGRLSRQKQYLNAFIRKTLDATKKDIRTPVILYNRMKPYIVTDLTADEIAYLATEFSGYRFNGDIYTLEGRTEMRDGYEAFYPDEDALKELLISEFYKEVEG